MTQLDDLVPGNAYPVRFSRKSGDPFNPTLYRVQFVFDSPKEYATQLRFTKIYNPAGGSSSGVTVNGETIEVTLSPIETAQMVAYPGKWHVYVSLGAANAQVNLEQLQYRILPVVVPPNGAVPNA